MCVGVPACVRLGMCVCVCELANRFLNWFSKQLPVCKSFPHFDLETLNIPEVDLFG